MASQRSLASLFFDPKVLVVLGASVLIAIVTAHYWILALGVLVVGLIIFLTHKERAAEIIVETARQKYTVADPQLPLGVEVEFRSRIQSIVDLQRRILTEIRDSKEEIRNLMDSSLPTIRGLGERHVQLILKLRDLSRYLQDSEAADIEADIKSLEVKIDKTSDSVTRQGLSRALEARREQLDVHKELGLGIERITAHLTGLEATMEKFKGQLIKMKSAEARHLTFDNEGVSRIIQDLNRDLDAVAEGVEETYGSERLTLLEEFERLEEAEKAVEVTQKS